MICIYAIINIVDDKQYVGQASDRDFRWREHRKQLRGFYHHNLFLQRAWCKHGESNFIFVVLEVLKDTKTLTEREQHWMDTLEPEYNIAKVANSSLGIKRSVESREKMRLSHVGKSWHTENSRKLVSERMKGNTHAAGIKQTEERIEHRAKSIRGKPVSQETRDKRSLAMQGKKPSEETKAKMSASAKWRVPPSEETRKKLSDAAKKQWEKLLTEV